MKNMLANNIFGIEILKMVKGHTHFLGGDEIHKLVLALVDSRGRVVWLIFHPSIFPYLFPHISLI